MENITDKDGTEWYPTGTVYQTKYLLESGDKSEGFDTLDDFHYIMFVKHKDDELEEMYDDHGLIALVFSKKIFLDE